MGKPMAGMRRFVTYIYAYEEEKKCDNVGFAKIEIRGEDCRMEIHLRGIYIKQALCEVYLFRELEGGIEGVSVGKMKFVNGGGDFSTIIKARNIGESEYDFDKMEGIFLLTEDDRIFMSRWAEGNPLVVCKENFSVWVKGEVTLEEKLQLIQQSQIMQEPQTTQESSVVHEEQPTLQATELPLRNIYPTYEWGEVWENLKENHATQSPFEDAAIECIQLELKNLRELPKRCWYLGNNSFLLHGFFNYQYIVIGRTADERYFIGVPGIYQRQERVMAAIFGFSEFFAVALRPSGDLEVEQGADTNQPAEPFNQFGCWCRYID